jgi:hypothetical protein
MLDADKKQGIRDIGYGDWCYLGKITPNKEFRILNSKDS